MVSRARSVRAWLEARSRRTGIPSEQGRAAGSGRALWTLSCRRPQRPFCFLNGFGRAVTTTVMTGFIPAIHVFASLVPNALHWEAQVVDGRVKPGHDDG